MIWATTRLASTQQDGWSFFKIGRCLTRLPRKARAGRVASIIFYDSSFDTDLALCFSSALTIKANKIEVEIIALNE
jgi:L-aminopeptidase/D-esterase-like protein